MFQSYIFLITFYVFALNYKGLITQFEAHQDNIPRKSNPAVEYKSTLQFLKITGAGRKLDDLVKQLRPGIETMAEKISPALAKLENLEKNIQNLKQTFSKNQQEKLRYENYAFLTSTQIEIIYGKNSKAAEFYKNIENHEKILENEIKKLAAISDDSVLDRSKRENNNESMNFFQPWTVMKPWAFLNRMNETVVFENTILSPHAFYSEYLVTDFNSHDILAPRAFKTALMSSALLFSRVLSPFAFGAEILSPRAFGALVLSPQTMLVEILTPQFFQAHVLSPDALTVQVLSPKIFTPRIGSPDSAGIVLLSPNIFSPRWLSEERMLIEILSPHIFGGEESEDEDRHNSHIPEDHRFHHEKMEQNQSEIFQK